MARHINSLKQEFDSAFKKLIDRLNSLTNDILLKVLGDNPNKAEKDKILSYWIKLQVKTSNKKSKLAAFQNDLNNRYHQIIV